MYLTPTTKQKGQLLTKKDKDYENIWMTFNIITDGKYKYTCIFITQKFFLYLAKSPQFSYTSSKTIKLGSSNFLICPFLVTNSQHILTTQWKNLHIQTSPFQCSLVETDHNRWAQLPPDPDFDFASSSFSSLGIMIT